jgi:hypothetical protein
MQTGLDDYNFSEKRMWRKWIWNRIKDKISVVPSKAVGLYLIGPKNEDFKIAINKKFKRNNLIGVDISSENVEKNRNGKCISICESFQNVIGLWPESPKIDFINADFCCGLNTQIEVFLHSLLYSRGIRAGTVVAVNMQRGREQEDIIKRMTDFSKYIGLSSIFSPWVNSSNLGDMNKHRGIWFFMLILEIIRIHLEQGNHLNCVRYLNQCHPVFYSYRSESRRIIMDSVVLVWPFDTFKKSICSNEIITFDGKVCKSITSKIAAAKAVRTIRMAA